MLVKYVNYFETGDKFTTNRVNTVNLLKSIIKILAGKTISLKEVSPNRPIYTIDAGG